MRRTFVATLVFALGCGGSQSPAPSPAGESHARAPNESTGAVAKAAAGPRGEVDGAALDKLAADEASSGSCDPDNKAALERFLDEAETNVRAKSEDGKALEIESFTKRVLALSEAPKGIQLTLSGKGTQVHVVAFSAKEVSLDVLAGKEAASTMRSAYKADLTKGPATIASTKLGGAVPLEIDSRQVDMRPGTPLDVRLRGQGCAGVVIFSKR